jgi:hypothetical protein
MKNVYLFHASGKLKAILNPGPFGFTDVRYFEEDGEEVEIVDFKIETCVDDGIKIMAVPKMNSIYSSFSFEI